MGHVRKGSGSLTLTGNSKGLTMAPNPTEIPWAARLALVRESIQPKETIPQALVDAWFEVATEAVKWFHEPDFRMLPALEYMDGFTDEEARARIAGFQKGYDKEYHRRASTGAWTDYYTQEQIGARERYVFSEWPFWLQRVVVSHWDRLHYEYLAAHEGLCYTYEEGYSWDIEGYHVKYLDMDKGVKPTEQSTPMSLALPYVGFWGGF
mgnify:CR=1 FL=1